MRAIIVGLALWSGIVFAQVPPPKGSSGGGGSGTVTGVIGTPPIVSDGSTTTPTISCTSATTGTAGCVSAGAQSISGSKTWLAAGHFSAGFDVTANGAVTFNNSIDGTGLSTVVFKSNASGDVGAGITFDSTTNAAGKKWSLLARNADGGFAIFNLSRSKYSIFCLDGATPTCAFGDGALNAASASWMVSVVSTFRVSDSAGTTNYFRVSSTGVIVGNGGTAVSADIANTSATVDFASTNTGACATDVTVTVTGATTGAACELGWAAAGPPAGWFINPCWVSSANTVTIRGCNFSAANPNDPASQTITVRVRNN
jgi:hypothetical protein